MKVKVTKERESKNESESKKESESKMKVKVKLKSESESKRAPVMRSSPGSSGVPRSFICDTPDSAGSDQSTGHDLKDTFSVNKP